MADILCLCEDLCVKLGGSDDVSGEKGVVEGVGPYVEMVHAEDVRDCTDVAAKLLHVYRFGCGVHEDLEDPACDGKCGKEGDNSKEEGCGWVGDVVERAVLCGSPVSKVVSGPDGACGGHDAIGAVADGVDKAARTLTLDEWLCPWLPGPAGSLQREGVAPPWPWEWPPPCECPCEAFPHARMRASMMLTTRPAVPMMVMMTESMASPSFFTSLMRRMTAS